MIDLLLFILYKLLKFIFLVLPKFLVRYLFVGLSRLVYMVDRKHKRYAKANLDLVYGDQLSEKEKYNIIKQTYENMFYNLYSFIENFSVDEEQLKQNTTVENEEVILKALEENRKIILITAHYGYWEYGSVFIPIKYGPTTGVGRPLNNKFLNKELEKSRVKFDAEVLSKHDASKGLVKALKNHRIVGLLIDQHHKQGIDVEFMGHKAKQIDSVSRLAMKFDALIIPVFFRRYGLGKYEVKFHDAIDPKEFSSQDDQVLALTQKQADIIGDEIRLHPESWLWQHRRWKAYYSDLYT